MERGGVEGVHARVRYRCFTHFSKRIKANEDVQHVSACPNLHTVSHDPAQIVSCLSALSLSLSLRFLSFFTVYPK